ncbi:MAG: hypothetical protein R3A48_09455 [Polyangiales bacterium]
MADHYIDYDETRIYGDYTVEQIAHLVHGRVRELDPALEFISQRLRVATDAVAAHLYAARAQDPEYHQLVTRREAPLSEARDVLTRFSKHLESHRAGSVAYGAFFVEPSATLARRGPQRLLAALDHVLGSLDEHREFVRDLDFWRGEIAAARAGLEAGVSEDRLIRARPVEGPGLQAARAHWLVVYGSAKHLVQAVLALSGSALGLDEIFDDLADVHHAEGVIPDAPEEPGDTE